MQSREPATPLFRTKAQMQIETSVRCPCPQVVPARCQGDRQRCTAMGVGDSLWPPWFPQWGGNFAATIAGGRKSTTWRHHVNCAYIGSCPGRPEHRVCNHVRLEPAGEPVKLRQVASGHELRTFTGHEDQVLSVAFSPHRARDLSRDDGKTLKAIGPVGILVPAAGEKPAPPSAAPSESRRDVP